MAKRLGNPHASREPRLNLEQSGRVSRARILGSGRDISIHLADSELMRLLAVITSDNQRPDLADGLPPLPEAAGGDYYRVPLSWFGEPGEGGEFIPHYLRLCEHIEDFETYFECLCELHKRRSKYSTILSAQPLPKAVQISPRALLEFGGFPVEALASWLTWRKWFFDIDNRAGQETGYLFELILAKSLGGSPCSAKHSLISRATGVGQRQVDCVIGRDAYEFKLRVTEAASNKGRFAQEKAFAEDCEKSGYRPVLLVLDPTPSKHLTRLVSAFKRHSGVAYLGDDVWVYVEARASATMAKFVERYVRQPIAQLDRHAATLPDLFASAAADRKSFTFRLGPAGVGCEWMVARAEDPALANGQEDGDATS